MPVRQPTDKEHETHWSEVERLYGPVDGRYEDLAHHPLTIAEAWETHWSLKGRGGLLHSDNEHIAARFFPNLDDLHERWPDEVPRSRRGAVQSLYTLKGPDNG